MKSACICVQYAANLCPRLAAGVRRSHAADSAHVTGGTFPPAESPPARVDEPQEGTP